MAVVTLKINNRQIKLACNDGEEARLQKVAEVVNEKLEEYKSANSNLTTEMTLIMCVLELQDNILYGNPSGSDQKEIKLALDSFANKLDQLVQKLN